MSDILSQFPLITSMLSRLQKRKTINQITSYNPKRGSLESKRGLERQKLMSFFISVYSCQEAVLVSTLNWSGPIQVGNICQKKYVFLLIFIRKLFRLNVESPTWQSCISVTRVHAQEVNCHEKLSPDSALPERKASSVASL